MTAPLAWFPILLLCTASSIAVSGQMHVEAHGCTANGRDYTCDKHNFHQILAASKTISVEAPRSDPYSLKRLDKLVRSLGKTVRSDPAELRLVLSSTEPDGIYYRPNDRKLATIRVYYGSGKLVWVESYFGQPDTPWPIAVDCLTEQFLQDFRK